MTDAQTLIALAERVEAAVGEDREIDAEIACVIGKPLGDIDHWLHGDDIAFRPTSHGLYVAIIPEVDNPEGRLSEAFKAAEFTGSLDAAMALVPEGCTWCIPGFVKPRWDARIIRDDGLIVVPLSQPCATPALALTVACLRARAHQIGEG